MQQANILVSVLDWGLGHATRCIPIIKLLQKQGAKITVACTPNLKNIFESEFQNINFLTLPGYNIKYSRYRTFFGLSLMSQLPRIILVLKKEKKWINNICAQQKFDAVISDNRFGFYHKKIPSVYITHQLFIETGNSFLNKLAQKIHYHFINKFSECWVPDVEEKAGLAGILSHPENLPKIPLHYLGIYSRFTKMKVEKEIDFLFILSGPEPQRTIFENLILKQLPALRNAKIVLVRGLPLAKEMKSMINNLKIFNHIPAKDLSLLIQCSHQIVCRSGYSSLLDLVSLDKTAHLIPTPGQTEQTYLAKHLNGKNGFSFQCQQNFSLKDLLKKQTADSANKIKAISNLEEVVQNFIQRLKV